MLLNHWRVSQALIKLAGAITTSINWSNSSNQNFLMLLKIRLITLTWMPNSAQISTRHSRRSHFKISSNKISPRGSNKHIQLSIWTGDPEISNELKPTTHSQDQGSWSKEAISPTSQTSPLPSELSQWQLSKDKTQAQASTERLTNRWTNFPESAITTRVWNKATAYQFWQIAGMKDWAQERQWIRPS